MISLKKTLKLLVLLFLLMVSASQAGTSMTFIHTDHLGSPIAATDESGQVKWTEEYQPFGKQRTNQDSDNTTGFTGHQYDDDLELTYMQARWYHPEVGRFMSLDPLLYRDVYSFNRYVYANDNPYKYVDPDGRQNEATFDMHVMYNHFGQSGVERYKNNRIGVDKYLMPVIPGAGVGDIITSIQQGEYLEAGLNAVMELPFAKVAKLGKLDDAVNAALPKHTRHSLNQKINRQVKSSDELDALNNPLDKRPIKYDNQGRPSQRYVGEKAEVAVNPDTNKIVSVNPTSTKKADRLKRRNEQ